MQNGQHEKNNISHYPFETFSTQVYILEEYYRNKMCALRENIHTLYVFCTQIYGTLRGVAWSLEIWLNLSDDLVNLSSNGCRFGENRQIYFIFQKVNVTAPQRALGPD